MALANQTETAAIGSSPATRRTGGWAEVKTSFDLEHERRLWHQSESFDTTYLVVPILSSSRAFTEPESEAVRPSKVSREDKLCAKIQSYLGLPVGWDGYDGVPASLGAIADAFDFLDMRPRDIPLPYAQLAPDGEVGLYWRTKEIYAEVGLYGDGEYSYYARYTPARGEPIEYGRDGCKLEVGDWPNGLLLVLNKTVR